jgi:hypothetical protein
MVGRAARAGIWKMRKFRDLRDGAARGDILARAGTEGVDMADSESRRVTRGSRWPGRLALVLGAVVLLVLALVGSASLLKGLNPFTQQTTDRSQPPVLKSIRNLSQYHAAVGDFQVVIDVENSISHVPTPLAGQRTLFVAAGTVSAFIDFSRMGDDALTVTGKNVQIRLPAPQLDKPNLDPDHSYVFSQRRGLLNRLAAIVSVPDQHEFYALAETRIAEAAKSGGILERAAANTRAMLSGMLHALGFEVTFVSATPGPGLR